MDFTIQLLMDWMVRYIESYIKSFLSISGKISTKMCPSFIGEVALHISRECARGFHLCNN